MRPATRKILAVLGVCLVFVLGMVAGGAVTARFIRHRAENLLTRRGSDLATERLARHLGDQLHCDAGQRTQVANILRSAHEEMWEVRREAAPRVRDIYLRAVNEIRGTLHPDQAKVLDGIVARQTARVHLDDELATPPRPVGSPTVSSAATVPSAAPAASATPAVVAP